MTLVVDASVAIRWSITMDRSDRAAALVESDEILIAPDLVIAEITNVVWKLIALGGREASATSAAVIDADEAFDELVPTALLKDRALEIALEIKHPAYDCFYLALAELRECRLVTADERLLRRCAKTPFGKLIKAL